MLEKIRVLQCAYEGPIAKIGGVGAVATDLSRVLNKVSVKEDPRSAELTKIFDAQSANILPYYPKIMGNYREDFVAICTITHLVLGLIVQTEVLYDEERASFYCKFLSAIKMSGEGACARRTPFEPRDLEEALSAVDGAETIYTTSPDPFGFLIRMHYFSSAVPEFARTSWQLHAWKQHGRGV